MKKINIKDKFSLFDEQWTPKIIAEANGQLVKIAKGSGELVWHKHDNEDELFIVFKGRLRLLMTMAGWRLQLSMLIAVR